MNGTSYKVELDKPVKAAPKPVTRPAAAPKTETGAPVVTKQPTASKKDGVKSPLPGVILDIKVKEGDTVKRGQTIIILEAMKMENNINANKDGKVAEIKVNKGDSVLEGTVYLDIVCTKTLSVTRFASESLSILCPIGQYMPSVSSL